MDKPQREVVFLALIWNHLGNILMVLKNGLWMLPGGHWDPKTNLFGTVEREIFEELRFTNRNLNPARLSLLHIHTIKSETKERDFHVYQFNYCGRQYNVNLGPRANEEEIKAVAWIPAASLLSGEAAVGEAVRLVMPIAVATKNASSQPIEQLSDDGGLPKSEQLKLFEGLGVTPEE
ncbi:MAG: NUDIX hydrolase [Candidatus Magasanikbacteria bacterium]|jgi:8-oxo-dGTP pyrophosphatase MutT (NUDIX family)